MEWWSGNSGREYVAWEEDKKWEEIRTLGNSYTQLSRKRGACEWALKGAKKWETRMLWCHGLQGKRVFQKGGEVNTEKMLQSPRSCNSSLEGHWCPSWVHFTWLQMRNLLIFKLVRRDQDGRIEGHGAHLFPQIHQKYIYMGDNSHRISTELWQKISYNQSCKKDHHVTG